MTDHTERARQIEQATGWKFIELPCGSAFEDEAGARRGWPEASAMAEGYRRGMMRAAEIVRKDAEAEELLAEQCREGSLDHTMHQFVARNYRHSAAAIERAATEDQP